MRPLKESYVDGKFTEDTIILRNESRGHCGEEYEGVEETIEMQDDRTEKYKTDGDRLFPEEGRVDAKMAEERVNGPEDSTASGLIKGPPQENISRLQHASKTASWDWKQFPVLGAL